MIHLARLRNFNLEFEWCQNQETIWTVQWAMQLADNKTTTKSNLETIGNKKIHLIAGLDSECDVVEFFPSWNTKFHSIHCLFLLFFLDLLDVPPV